MVANLNSNRNIDGNRLNVNGNNWNDNNNGYAFGMALESKAIIMKTYNSLYNKIISLENLAVAWRKARKGKTKKYYVIKFEEDLFNNLLNLHNSLRNKTYCPKPLQNFILRDPKTRNISKSDFSDRIVHHALVNVLEPIFDKTFIYDSYANRKTKGNLVALERFYYFLNKISENGKTNGILNNNQIKGYCLKADIKHYFQEINLNILLQIIERKIKDKDVMWLIKQILYNKTGFVGGGRSTFCN